MHLILGIVNLCDLHKNSELSLFNCAALNTYVLQSSSVQTGNNAARPLTVSRGRNNTTNTVLPLPRKVNLERDSGEMNTYCSGKHAIRNNNVFPVGSSICYTYTQCYVCIYTCKNGHRQFLFQSV